MKPMLKSFFVTVSALALAIPAAGQVGKNLNGVLEPNLATKEQLVTVPNVTPAIADAIIKGRPYANMLAVDKVIAPLIPEAQRTALYPRMFVHVDVNRGTDAELLLIPGMDAKKLAAVKAGRPWKSFDAFRTAMTTAANAGEAARLEQYFFIPIELNTFTEQIMDTFASIGVGTSRWKREFAEYRPWTSMAQFEREIGKYVRGRPTELKRLQRYVIINP